MHVHRRLIQKRTPGTSVQPVRPVAGGTQVPLEKLNHHTASYEPSHSGCSPVC